MVEVGTPWHAAVEKTEVLKVLGEVHVILWYVVEGPPAPGPTTAKQPTEVAVVEKAWPAGQVVSEGAHVLCRM
jgi:hypothetical protein